MTELAPELASRRMSPAGLALLSVAAPLLFWLAVIVAGAARPGYDHVARPISDLGVGPNAALLELTFVAYGSVTIAIAVALRGVLPPLARAGSTLLLLSGAFTALLGLEWLAFVVGGSVPAAPTRVGALSADRGFDLVHNAFAAATFLLGGVAPLAAAVGLRRESSWRWEAYALAVCGVVAVALLPVVAVSPPGAGALERILVVPLQVWVAVVAFRNVRAAPAVVALHARQV